MGLLSMLLLLFLLVVLAVGVSGNGSGECFVLYFHLFSMWVRFRILMCGSFMCAVVSWVSIMW